MPSRYAPYGYKYDRDRRTYLVEEQRIEVVRALFRMVGVEGKALWAIKRLFDTAGYETRTGGHWHLSTLRDMVLNDVYLAHTTDELRGLEVTEEVLASLDPDALYGGVLVQHPARRDPAEWQADQDPAIPGGLNRGADSRCRDTSR